MKLYSNDIELNEIVLNEIELNEIELNDQLTVFTRNKQLARSKQTQPKKKKNRDRSHCN